MDMRPVTAAEFPAFMRTLEAAFHEPASAEDTEAWSTVFEPERSIAAFDAGSMVATAAAFTRELTIPGAVMTVAAVTAVGVLPTHRRRGLMTELMRRQLDDVRAAGESVATLWASEPVIYGRFGYGLAARHGALTLPTGGARLRPGVPVPDGRTVLAEPADAIERIAPLYDRVRRERIGHLGRTDEWWRRRVHDPEAHRDGRGPLRAAVHETPDGAVDAYALYGVRREWNESGPNSAVVVREVVADGPEATAGIWSFLIGLDLTRSLEAWPVAPDEAIFDLVEGPGRPLVRVGPNLFVRLVDVDAALAARTYAAPFEVVLEVEDAFCPWNAGRHRLAWDGATAVCAPTEDPADLALGVGDLGAAFLGGMGLAALAAIGRVRELRPGTLAPVAHAFRALREPWCPEMF